MQVNVKVAGTTFHPLPENDFVKVSEQYEFEGVPCATADAVLIPEPTNKYDPDAIMVMVPLVSGGAFHIGYVPKDATHFKSLINHNYVAKVMIKNFAAKNPQLCPSWIITEVIGL